MNASIPRISRSTLSHIGGGSSSAVALPPRQILDAPERVLQIGFGRFVRGFIADFLQQAVATGEFCGRMLAVQRKGDQRMRNFQAQDGLYTLIARGQVKGSPVDSKQIVASISRVLAAETAWPQVIQAVLRPKLKVLTTNVSEGGLELNEMDELQSAPPVGYPGKLTQLLYRRWQNIAGQEASIALIPCELVENNGDLVLDLIVKQSRHWHLEQDFLRWLENSLHVANTVVDRIVVGEPPNDQLAGEWKVLGYRDNLINCAEPFYEFILVADDFTRQHFPLDRACSSVRFVTDLSPYRTRKVLILNGSHTVMASLGRVLGIPTVLQSMDDTHLGSLVETMMFEEIIPALSLADDMDPRAYARDILERFRNPYVQHQLQDICLNSSVKAGTRIFPSMRRYMKLFGRVPSLLALGLAGVLLALRDPELQDTHGTYIRERWQQVKPECPDTLLAFTREILSRQMEWSREAIDLEPVSKVVAQFLWEVVANGLRPLLARRLDGVSSADRDPLGHRD